MSFVNNNLRGLLNGHTMQDSALSPYSRNGRNEGGGSWIGRAQII